MIFVDAREELVEILDVIPTGRRRRGIRSVERRRVVRRVGVAGVLIVQITDLLIVCLVIAASREHGLGGVVR